MRVPGATATSPIWSRLERLAAHERHRRIEPHRLFQDHARIGETRERVRVGCIERLGGDARIGIGKLREQEQRPGQRVRGGLVAGADEGHQIVVHHGVGQRRAGLGIARLDQPRHQIVRHAFAGRDARAAALEQPQHFVAKDLLRRPRADEGRARQPARQRQHVPQIDAAERLEIGGDRLAHHVRRRLDLVAEHRARDDVVGQPRSSRARRRSSRRTPRAHPSAPASRRPRPPSRRDRRRRRPAGTAARRCGAAAATTPPPR